MKLFAFAASLRQGSLNRRLLDLVIGLLSGRHGLDVTDVPFSEVVAPNYNFDDQQATGFPAPTERLTELFREHDGAVVVSPEYNFGIPGTLKNAIDWLSRIKPLAPRGKHMLLLSASTSLVGGNRGLWALRVPFELLGVRVYPEMYSLAQADKAFADDGTVKEPALQERLEKLVAAYVDYGERLS